MYLFNINLNLIFINDMTLTIHKIGKLLTINTIYLHFYQLKLERICLFKNKIIAWCDAFKFML